MASTLAFRCANDPKDFGLWDAHKDTFRKLFLTDNKSLAEVKSAMEESGFPQTNVKTYEVVLREHFKFRKNLEAGQWLLVGQELDKWKSQGLDCDVSLSGITQYPKVVNRKIRRERTEAARGKLKHNKSLRFPEAVTITPKVQPTLDIAGSTPPNIIESLGSFLSLAQECEPASTTSSAPMSLSDPRLSLQQLFHDARVVGLQADFVEHILHNPIRDVYEKLGKNVPSRELISFLRGLWENTRLSPRERTILGGILSGFINLTRNMPPFRNERLPDPRLFGLNDSFSVLETTCTSLCNGRVYTTNNPLLSSMRKWLSTIADIEVLQQFFSLPTPAVAAVWDTLIWALWFDQSVYAILVEVALRVHRGKWIHRAKERFLAGAIKIGAESIAKRLIDSWQVSAGTVETLVHKLLSPSTFGVYPSTAPVQLAVKLFPKLHAPLQLLDATIASLLWQLQFSQAAAVHWLVQEGTKIQPGISDWIPPCFQHLPPDWKPAWDPYPLTPQDLGVTACDPRDPKVPCRNIFETILPFLGILASARSGQDTLRRFMSYLSTYGRPERERILRLALAETTRKHDIETTKLLLETSMFIQMEPFQRYSWYPYREISDPVVESANMMDPEMLQLLLSHRLFENYHVSDILDSMSNRCYSPPKIEWRPTVDFLLERNWSSLKDIWDESSSHAHSRSRDLIRDYVQRRVSRQRPLYLEFQDLLCTIFPNDTLRETIKNGFGIDAVESLVAAGIRIPFDSAGGENTLLIDALLTCSRDRYQIVHFLLRNGADPRMSSSSLTVLEAILRPSYYRVDSSYMDDSNVTLDLFRELSQLGAPFKRQTAPTTPRCPFSILAMLIKHGASISLLQQAVTAGAQINEYGTDRRSPLDAAVNSDDRDTVKWLLDLGADVNSRPRPKPIEGSSSWYSEFTALEYAVARGNMDMVILLLSHGATINNSCKVWFGDKPGRLYNAVDLASRFGQLDILQVLVDSGGQSGYPGLSGLDGAFWEASQGTHSGITMFLEQHTRLSAESIIGNMEEKLKTGQLG